MDLKHFRIDASSNTATTVWIDVAERPVNVLWEPVFDEIEQLLPWMRQFSANHTVLFRSSKPTGFMAGADLKRIASLATDEETANFVCRGQELFDQLASLPAATVAVVDGPCLGGGLEFALACRYRVAVDQPKTMLGCPETELGLIPAWGGTQRLPERVGLAHALWMILSGEAVNALRAGEMGLVDAVTLPDAVESELERLAGGAAPLAALHQGRPSLGRSLLGTTPGRWWLYISIRRRLRTGSLTPAQAAAWEAVMQGWRRSYADGLWAERTYFCELIKTPACREALQQFLTRRSK